MKILSMELSKHRRHSRVEDCLIESVAISQNRSNLTMNDTKRCSSERAALQSDIWRLQSALYVVNNNIPDSLLSRDTLVKHQSEEIHRLMTTNNCMKTKLKSMSNALLDTEKTIAWNVDKKVRNEMTKINSQVAEERLQLAREILRLKKQLENTDTNEALELMKTKLNNYSEGDKKFDQYLYQVTSKAISTVNDLSNKLLKTNEILKKSESEKIYLRNESMQLKSELAKKNNSESQLDYFTCLKKQETQQVDFQIEEKKNTEKFKADCIYLQEIKDEVEGLRVEKEILLKEKLIREKALMRYVSGIKTKLAIALMRNEKLNEKIKSLEHDVVTKLSMVKTNLPLQSEGEVERLQLLLEMTKEQLRVTNARLAYLDDKWNESDDKKQLEKELIMLQERNNEIATQLVMERTTAQEALKEFERSTKEVERLQTELEDVKIESITLKKDLTKIKMENCELRDAKIIFKKKNMILREESVKKHESLQEKVRIMRMRNNKLMGDLKKSDYKKNQDEETETVFDDEKLQLQDQVDVLTKRLEEIVQESNEMREEKLKIEETLREIELEKKEWTIKHDSLNDGLKNLECQLRTRQLENLNINELLCESKKINEDLENKCQQNDSDIQILMNRLKVTETECKELKNCIEMMSSELSTMKASNLEMEMIIDSIKIENNQLKGDRAIFDKEKVALECQIEKLQDEMKAQSIVNHSNISGDFLKEELIKQSIEGSMEMINREFVTKVFDQFINHSEKTLLKSLEDTDIELQTVKSELAKVKYEVIFLRTDFDNGKFGSRSLTFENNALREELVKIRIEKQKLKSTIRELEKVAKMKS